LSQHWLFDVQVSPVSRHEEAGTSHLLLTQLSEQQSVFLVQALLYGRHVAQLTPAKHVVPPKQQPFAQDVALQTHVPLRHCWPAAHCGPLPQLHDPFEQPSATIVLHEVHALPLPPQFVTDGGSHVLPLQQPVVQVCEQPSHTWLTHVLVPHDTHAAPPPPHWVLAVPS
jgi:hypothetical protein